MAKFGSGDAKRIGTSASALPGRSGNGANFNHTGGNTGKSVVSPAKAKSSSRSSQKNNMDFQKLAHSDKAAGRTAPRSGGGGTFMNRGN